MLPWYFFIRENKLQIRFKQQQQGNSEMLSLALLSAVNGFRMRGADGFSSRPHTCYKRWVDSFLPSLPRHSACYTLWTWWAFRAGSSLLTCCSLCCWTLWRTHTVWRTGICVWGYWRIWVWIWSVRCSVCWRTGRCVFSFWARCGQMISPLGPFWTSRPASLFFKPAEDDFPEEAFWLTLILLHILLNIHKYKKERLHLLCILDYSWYVVKYQVKKIYFAPVNSLYNFFGDVFNFHNACIHYKKSNMKYK